MMMNGDLMRNNMVSVMGPVGVRQACDSRFGAKQATRVSLVVSIPIVLLIGITINVLTLAIEVYNRSTVGARAVDMAIELSTVVNKLQVERGLSAMFLSSNRSSLRAFATVMEARAATELQLYHISRLPVLVIGNRTLASREQLLVYINEHRVRVTEAVRQVSLEENMNFYTDINQAMMQTISASIQVPSHDRWLVAFNSLFQAKDIAGIKRAIGSTFYARCAFSPKHLRWFMMLDEQFNTYMSFTFSYHPMSKQRSDSTMDPHLRNNLKMYNDYFTDSSYTPICLSDPLDARMVLSQAWFDNMTLYMSHLSAVMTNLADDLTYSLSEQRQAARNEMIIYSSMLIFVLMCSGATVYLIYVMTAGMQRIATTLNSKTIELDAERAQMEELLDQMLPKTVADKLKMKLEVKAEYYEMVTIYFSDVVGFTRISALLSPHQVVDFLNALYSLFDTVIDRHDAYKVETIGDAYMVASGIPERNGSEHAPHIARMALDILQSSSSFIIPHTDEFILVRSGIHSGPCASGIVGKKMPRYCLFGDTVNTASRMESTGEARRIHVSSTTKALLDIYGGFTTDERGGINVKGKGTMTTYWLVGADTDKEQEGLKGGNGKTMTIMDGV